MERVLNVKNKLVHQTNTMKSEPSVSYRREGDAFNQCINSPHGVKAMEAFMKRTNTDDVLKFHLAVATYRKLDQTQLIACAQNIYDRYLDPNPSARNVVTQLFPQSSVVIDKLKRGRISADMFEKVQREALVYLRFKVFVDFCEDPAYAEYLEKVNEASRPRADMQSAPPIDGNLVYQTGWLMKRGNVVRSWKRRYFVLTCGILFSYKQPSDTQPIKRFLVDGCGVFVTPEKRYNRAYCLEVAAHKRVLILQASSEGERNSWRAALMTQNNQMRELRSLHRSLERELECCIECAETVKAARPFTAYKIRVKTPGLTWFMRRRFSEFVALHRLLNDEFGDVMFRFRVAEFPSRQVLFNNMDERVIQERMSMLNAYMNDIIRVPVIASSVDVLQFLGLLNPQHATGSNIDDNTKTVDADHVPSVVEVGDILLMRSATSMGALQRTLTQSEYDHVGVVVRVPILSNKPHTLAVFEAVGEGVVIQPLETRLCTAQRVKQSVAIRKLRWKRDPQRLLSLQSFCDTVNGRAKYSVKGFFSRKAKQNDVSYYCSELVAACYEALQLLPDGAASSKPWLPVHFSCKKRLELVGDATLDDEELLVVFDHIELADAVSTSNNDGMMTSTASKHARRHSFSSINDMPPLRQMRSAPALLPSTMERSRRGSAPQVTLSMPHITAYQERNILNNDAKSKKLANILGRDFVEYANLVRQKSLSPQFIASSRRRPSANDDDDDDDDDDDGTSDGDSSMATLSLDSRSNAADSPRHPHPALLSSSPMLPTSPENRRQNKLAAMLGGDVPVVATTTTPAAAPAPAAAPTHECQRRRNKLAALLGDEVHEKR